MDDSAPALYAGAVSRREQLALRIIGRLNEGANGRREAREQTEEIQCEKS